MTDQAALAGALDALDAEPTRVGGTCRVAAILAALDPALRQALEEKLANASIVSTRIAATLSAHGHPVRASSVQRHRRRATGAGCVCAP